MLRIALACCLVAACLGASPLPRRPRPDGRIVGGVAIAIESAPYQLSLEYEGNHRCGAAIINKDYAVTAAHCTWRLSPKDITFRAGSADRGSGGSLHQAVCIQEHKQYNSFEMDYDVSLVRVFPAFNLTQNTSKSIAIASSAPETGDQVVITGWGVTAEGSTSLSEKLQVVTLNVVNHDDCSKAYAAYGGVTNRMMCAGVPEGGKDACQGDSGGPVIGRDKNQLPVLVGLVSWGTGCGRNGFPGVNTDVYSVNSFLQNPSCL